MPHKKVIAFDTETWLATPGLYVPPMVCASFADSEGEYLHGVDDGLAKLEDNMRPGITISGAHLAYDTAVSANEWPALTQPIFDHYDRQGFFDILIGQALDHVARGHLFKQPDGSKMRGPDGDIRKRYSLELVTWQLLQQRAKDRDTYRLRYGELSKIPREQWPTEATEYPKDDARNTLNCATKLLNEGENIGPVVRVIPSEAPTSWKGVYVTWAGNTQPTLLTHEGLNTYAAFCLHLLSAWGLRANVQTVAKLIESTEVQHLKEMDRFAKIGLLTPAGKENRVEVRRRLIRAYNPNRGDVPCNACAGTGKTISAKSGNEVQCKACSATGLDMGMAPTTPTDGVCADRDACAQSGDTDLKDLKASTNRKIRETFVPFLIDGVSYPINVMSNPLMATARTSFGKQEGDDDSAPGLLQTFPRGSAGKVGPRECLEAPRGWVLCSNDWNALEFANLGQAQRWVMGYSPIVDAINSGSDAHVILGAKMLGIAVEEFKKSLKDPVTASYFKNIRQGTKAGNFGFGGRMGAPKFVLTQRRQAIGGHGSMCRLLGRETPQTLCGSRKITTWKKRPCPPVCEICCQVSEELRLGWLELWQLKEYFAWVDSHDNIQDGEATMLSPGTGFARGGLNVSEGCNHPFQHLGGYGSKLALCMVTRECYVNRGTALYGCRPVIFAHDEIITLMPESIASEAALRQTHLMHSAMAIICPDVKIGIAPALMKQWWKSAEDCYRFDDCPRCSDGWIYGEHGGKKTRVQCDFCKTHGRLSVWSPPPWELAS